MPDRSLSNQKRTTEQQGAVALLPKWGGMCSTLVHVKREGRCGSVLRSGGTGGGVQFKKVGTTGGGGGGEIVPMK